MPSWRIVVADASRARLLVATRSEEEDRVTLTEYFALVNPERNLRGQDVFSNLKSGRNRSPTGGPAHGYDDHRTQHDEEVERRFAQRVVAITLNLPVAQYLVVVAPPRLLGLLRPEFDRHLPHQTRKELTEDLSWHSLQHIRRVLELRGVLPSGAPRPLWRPRGQPVARYRRRVRASAPPMRRRHRKSARATS